MNWLVTALASLGGCGFIGTTIVALLNRRKIKAEASKTGADAAAVLTGSAMQLLERVQSESIGLRRELIEARAELDNMLVAIRAHTEKIQEVIDQQAPGVAIPAFRYPLRAAPDYSAGSK